MIRSAIACAAAILALACGDDHDQGVDAGGGDADVAEASLAFSFRSIPDIPGSLEADLGTIDLARLELESVRAVGDAAPGDETTRSSLILEWSAEAGPGPLVFWNAPAGLYSRLSARVVGYEVRGTVAVDGETWTFVIEDAPLVPLTISLELSEVAVVPGEATRVDVEVDFEAVVGEIDWSSVESSGDELELGSDDPQIAGTREEIASLWSQASP